MMPRTIAGTNDLQTLYPDIAKEAHGWDPSKVSANSNDKKNWKCVQGHFYESRPSSRTRISNGRKSRQGCPYCSGKRVLSGFNDLHTTHPEIAAEAYEWDPTSVTHGSKTEQKWQCSLGHVYSATPNSRTSGVGTGCPYCAGKKVWEGFNDLASKFPDTAEYAEGWDPTQVTYGSNKEKNWKCPEGHTFTRSVKRQIKSKYPCPYCPAERVLRILPSVNDLATLFPEIANEADGWDPSEFTSGSNEKKKWKCSLGHSFEQVIVNRTTQKQGCPICSNRQVLTGFNDLLTVCPEIAKEAHDFDPSQVLWGSASSVKWACPEGHIYESKVSARTSAQETGCPICAGRKVLLGYNDLQTHFPEIAKEAHGWDPTKFTKASSKKLDWKCPNGHIYPATINNRTAGGSGCPICTEFGFSSEQDAWLYLMEREGEQQFGITNVPKLRARQHAVNGWVPIDWHGPALGKIVLELETKLKRWLKVTYDTLEGTKENWSTDDFKVKTLEELGELSGVNLSVLPHDQDLSRREEN